jgi:uncharacterized SAM-binding protein YcdF (DUF218 family)
VSFRWLLWSLFSPSQILLGAVVLGALLWLMGRHKTGRWLCIAGGAGIFLFGLLPLSHYLVYPLEHRFPQPELPPEVAGIVLLAGAERAAATEAYSEPQLNSFAARYTTTLRLATRYPYARVVFTGGPQVDDQTGRLGQTGVAAMLLPSIGIAGPRLTIEDRSTDTCQSAAHTKALVQPKPGETWVVVTSAIHVPRTVACFRAVGWDVIPKPADYRVVLGAWDSGSFRMASNLALLDTAMHEWLGLLYYRLTNRTLEVFPSP